MNEAFDYGLWSIWWRNYKPCLWSSKTLEDKIMNPGIIKKEIPTVFYKSIEVLENLIENEKLDIVICIG